MKNCLHIFILFVFSIMSSSSYSQQNLSVEVVPLESIAVAANATIELCLDFKADAGATLTLDGEGNPTDPIQIEVCLDGFSDASVAAAQPVETFGATGSFNIQWNHNATTNCWTGTINEHLAVNSEVRICFPGLAVNTEVSATDLLGDPTAGVGLDVQLTPHNGDNNNGDDTSALDLFTCQDPSNGNSSCYDCNGNGVLDATDALNPDFSAVCLVHAILPVKLLYYEVEGKGINAVLTWVTASEENNSHFEVERSADGKTWNTIGELKGKGTTSTKQEYSYTDNGIGKELSTVYYRLRQVDYDGAYEYSNTDVVNFDQGKGSVFIYPNPVRQNLYINVSTTDEYTVEIYNVLGALVAQTNKIILDVSTLESGSYIVKVVDQNSKVLKSQKIVVIK